MRGQHLVHHDQGRLVGAQRPIQRVAGERRDQFGAADDEARLRAAEELVARETHRVGAGVEDLAHRLFVGHTPSPQIVESPGSLVDEERQPVGVRELGELGGRRLGGEADDPEVGLVGDENRRGVFVDRRGIVLEVGAVRAADLHQGRAGGGHDVGEAEGAADLDQLPAGDDHLAVAGVSEEHQKERRRIVVDHHRAGGAADRSDPFGDRRQTLTPAASGDVVLQGKV